MIVIEHEETIYNADTGETSTTSRTLEFVESEKPDDGCAYDEILEERDGKLFQMWIMRSEDISDAEALEILFGGAS